MCSVLGDVMRCDVCVMHGSSSSINDDNKVYNTLSRILGGVCYMMLCM
jgi:hypothetical protein